VSRLCCGIIEAVYVEEARYGELEGRIVTAPIAAGGLIAGFAVAVGTGSRPLGGVVLAACGLACVAVWWRRDGRRTALVLAAAGLSAFALSHLLGAVIGAWPAVLVLAAATAGLCWRMSDRRRRVAPGLRRGGRADSPRRPLPAGRPGPSA
jgi:hypothetical protein